MKYLLLIVVVAVAYAEKYDLEFLEKGDYYKQDVKVDRQKNTVEYDVPQHAGVEEAKYFLDYQQRLVVMKLNRLGVCYAWDMKKDEFKPDEIKEGLKKIHGKFPEHKYMVVNENMLPLATLNTSSITADIKDFCGTYPVIKVAVFKDRSSMESAALTAAKLTLSSKRKRRATVTDFYLCDNNTSRFVGECGRSGNQLKIKCKFVVAQTCVFKVGCKFTATGWNCPVPDHMFHYLHCCDYGC